MTHKIKELDHVCVIPRMAQSKNEITMLANNFRDGVKYIVGEVIEQGARIIGYPLVIVPFECMAKWEDENGD